MHPKLISLENQFARSILTKVSAPCLDRRQVELWIKRDDLLHPIVSGNKWRKLKYILNHALSQGAIKIVSMGGAYSNHLHALAYVGHRLGIQTEGFIRGEPQSNPTLSDLRRWGMRLQFVSREDYRNLRQYKHWNSLPGIDTNAYWLPEGGRSIWLCKAWPSWFRKSIFNTMSFVVLAEPEQPWRALSKRFGPMFESSVSRR